MNKKEQKIYADSVRKKVQDKGLKMGFFLKSIGISNTHWHFIKNGDRPLTDENKEKIELLLNK